MIHMYKVTLDKFAKASGCLKTSQSKFIDVDFVQVNKKAINKTFSKPNNQVPNLPQLIVVSLEIDIAH